MAYCPACVSYGTECHVDPMEWDEHCPFFKSLHEELEAEREDQ